MALDWKSEAREIKKAARANGSTEILLQPIFKGKKLCLEYRDLKLRIKDIPKNIIAILRRSGVPRMLVDETYKRWGGVTPSVLYIHGVLIRSRKDKTDRRFLPVYVCGEDGVEYHNQITSIQLLFARGFFTPITQSGWMHTAEVNPRSLQKRLDHVGIFRLETRDGKKFFTQPPLGLELFDCMGWEPPKKKRK